MDMLKVFKKHRPMHFSFIFIAIKRPKDNEVVLLINTFQLLYILFIISHTYCVSELGKKVLVHCVTCIDVYMCLHIFNWKCVTFLSKYRG